MGSKNGFETLFVVILVTLFGSLWLFVFVMALDPKHPGELFSEIVFVGLAIAGLGYVAVQNHKDTKEVKNRTKKCAPAKDEIDQQWKAKRSKEIADRLDLLSELYRNGKITTDEYNYARRKILDEL